MFSIILKIFINILVSVIIILIFHYLYYQVFKKKEKSHQVLNCENEKYKEINKQLENIQYKSSPFKDENEKKQMSKELLQFMEEIGDSCDEKNEIIESI